MKILRSIALLCVLLLVLGIAFFIFQQGINPLRTHSTNLLESIETLSQLETVEFLYQFVFPYDFSIDDTTMLLIEQGRIPLEQLPEESQQAYTISTETGLRKAGKTRFVVLGMRIRAGVVLDDPRFSVETPEPNTLYIRLPYPRIQSIIALDIQKPYNYPEAPLDARELRRVSAFVKLHATQKAIEDGILEESAESLQSFLEQLLATLTTDTIHIEFVHDLSE